MRANGTRQKIKENGASAQWKEGPSYRARTRHQVLVACVSAGGHYWNNFTLLYPCRDVSVYHNSYNTPHPTLHKKL